jgi:hypothetical protein
MGTLGKVLIFLNILLAAGVAYLATQSWAQRQDQNAVALRYYLLIDGLPLEAPAMSDSAAADAEVELPITLPGGVPIQAVRAGFLKNHFQGTESGISFANPTPPNSVLGEFKKVRTRMEALLAAKKPAEKLAYLIGTVNPTTLATSQGLLIYLADTFDERLALKDLLTGQAPAEIEKNAKEAEALLLKRFDSLIAAANPKQSGMDEAALANSNVSLGNARMSMKQALDDRLAAAKAANTASESKDSEQLKLALDRDNIAQEAYRAARVRYEQAKADHAKLVRETAAAASYDEPTRRMKIASLLLHLDFDTPLDSWQKRVALIVGLKDYLAAIKERTQRLVQQPQRYQRLQEQSVLEFVEIYEKSKAIAIDRDRLLDRQREITRALTIQATEEKNLTVQRKTQRDLSEQELLAIQASVNAAMADQAKIEAQLFAIQKQVGSILRQNFELEDQIVVLEQAKLGGR